MSPNIWIGDTGANTDMTPHEVGMKDLKKPLVTSSVIMGNKQMEKTTEVGNFQSAICINLGISLPRLI